MFDKILIANRGGIALRIMRAARELGIKTVAVYSTDDADTYPVRYADEAVCIGPAKVEKSYLNMSNVIAAATMTGAQAIHPGWGYFAEDAEFARACAANDLVFIGPSADCIESLSDKSAARAVFKACGVPTVPGSSALVQTAAEARAAAQRAGYPAMIKAASGRNGIGVEKAYDPGEVEMGYRAARAAADAVAESSLAPVNEGVYVEKLIEDAHHVEIQVLGDAFGNRLALCERDCSVQLKGHKLIEEAPSPALDDDLRRAMSVAAVKAVRALNYQGAGTVKFLLAPDGHFYFMSMSTRIRVGHPLTEQVTGVDIVKEQIRIASGEPMSCADRAPFVPFGHAIEFKIEAEDPAESQEDASDDALARPHVITRFQLPSGPGVRVETSLGRGSSVPTHHDRTIANLIVYGQDREEAIARARRALDEFIVEGVCTTIPFHRRVLDNKVFCAGETTTDFIEIQMGDLI